MSTHTLPSTADGPIRLPNFLAEARSLYRHHWGLFLRLILFAFVFGYLAVAASSEKASAIARTLPPLRDMAGRMTEILPALAEMWAARLVGFLVPWLLYCFAFAAVVEAVGRIRSGDSPDCGTCFAKARERAGSWIRIALFVFTLLFVAFLFSLPVTIASYEMGHRITPQHVLAFMDGFAVIFWLLVVAFVSNYALAIPAAVAEEMGAASALARSNELTDGRLAILMWLILESVLGTYLAAVAPFWVAHYVFNATVVSQLVYWTLLVCGAVLSGLVQPLMLVGLSLLYWKVREAAPSTASPA